MIAFEEDSIAFLQWMQTPIPALSNWILNELAISIIGAEIVNEELLRIEHSIFN